MADILTLRAGSVDYRVELRNGQVLVDGVPVERSPRAWAAADGDTRWVFIDGEVFQFEVQRQGRRKTAAHQGSLSAPMSERRAESP